MIRELTLLVLLVLVSYRATRLVIKDTLPPALWMRDRLAGGWRRVTESEWQQVRDQKSEVPFVTTSIGGETHRWVLRWKWSPDWLAELITCPWCASGWVSGALVGVTDCVVGIQWPWLMGGAAWAGAALIASQEWA